jgi:hypothetical protein
MESNRQGWAKKWQLCNSHIFKRSLKHARIRRAQSGGAVIIDRAILGITSDEGVSHSIPVY